MMRPRREWLQKRWTRFWAPPDELILELGAGGELLVARLRVFLSLLILLLPLVYGLWGQLQPAQLLVSVGVAVLVNIAAQAWLALARNPRHYPWLPYITSSYDVTSTTGMLALLATTDAVSAVNSVVIWAFYLLSIAMTALRHDGRLALYTGTLAFVQYAVLVIVVFQRAASPDDLFSVAYGTASLADQISRLLLLVMMTLMTATIVYRMQRLVELSGNDGLTGLPNRTWLVQRMPQLIEAVRSDNGSMTLVLLDIDQFHKVNEDYGHLGGDRVIRHLAVLAQQGLAEQERLVRLGGQEFVALLHAPTGSAWERMDRMRRDIAQHAFPSTRGNEACRITVSGGLASFPNDGQDLPSLLRSANRRLQAAKHAGRNRVVARDI